MLDKDDLERKWRRHLSRRVCRTTLRAAKSVYRCIIICLSAFDVTAFICMNVYSYPSLTCMLEAIVS